MPSKDFLALNPGFDAAVLPRQTRGRATRPDVPSAGRSPSTGLSSLILRAWSTEFDAVKGYRLYKVNSILDTGYWPSEAQACAVAKEMEK